MHNYMYAKIKFHTYSDIISEESVTVSRKRELKQLKDYQSYTAYYGNEGSILHRQSTGGCVCLELNNIFKRLHNNFIFWAAVSKGEYTYGWYSARPQEITKNDLIPSLS